MKRRTLVNFLLLVSAALLAALVIYEPGGTDDPASPSPLTPLSRGEITRIHVKQDSNPEITLQKQGNGLWQMTTPLPLPASQYRVDSLLQLADTPSLGSFNIQDRNLSIFGLNPPKVVLTFNQLTLRFGNTEPLSGHRYVAVTDKIHLVNDSAYYSVIARPAAFADHALLPANSDIEGLTLPGLYLWHERDRWHAKPASEQITTEAIEALVNEWQHSEAMSIEPLGNKKPEGETVSLRLAGQDNAIYFVIIQRQPELKLARPDLKLLYILPPDSAARLTELPVSKSDAGTP